MNKILKIVIFVCAVSCLTFSVNAADFKEVTPGYLLDFPRDHGSHPDYNTEWWYFVGHLKSDTDKTFGFELTFFRIGLDPEAKSESAWRHHSLYLTHFALTDDRGKKFYHDERISRGAFQEAGAEEGQLKVWNRDWIAELSGDKLTLQAESEEFAVNLILSPEKDLILHGNNGFSQKGAALGEASYYSSFTRLKGFGKVRVGGDEIMIQQAQAWMDHEVTSQDLPEGISGWDWFAIQLDNGEEIMVYQLREAKGNKNSFSKGTYVLSDGKSKLLKAGDYEITVLEKWISPDTGIEYPIEWQLSFPELGYQLNVKPTLKQQELKTLESTGVIYWEGRCLVSGKKHDQKVTGQAYVELTGYDKPLAYR